MFGFRDGWVSHHKSNPTAPPTPQQHRIGWDKLQLGFFWGNVQYLKVSKGAIFPKI